jgi:hypothetical protein
MINWTITVGTSTKTIPNVKIKSNEYLIVCTSYAYDELSNYGNAVGVYNLGALVNAGATVRINDNTGQLISSVTYSDSWYKDEEKKRRWLVARNN